MTAIMTNGGSSTTSTTHALPSPYHPSYAPTYPSTVSSSPPQTAYNSGGSNGMLQMGSQGSNVAAIQKQLGISADGVYGGQTANAVKQFQQQHGLTVDGIVGPQTLAAMQKAQSASNNGFSVKPPASTGLVKQTTGGTTSGATPPPASTPPQQPTDQSQGNGLDSTVTTLLQQLIGQNQGMSSQDMQSLQTLSQQMAQQQLASQQQALQKIIDQANSSLNESLMGVSNNTQDAMDAENNTAFQDYLTARQAMADRGLAGSGLASDQDTRLLLQKQQAMAGIYRQAGQQTFTAQQTAANALNDAYNQMSALNPDATANQIFQQMYQSALANNQKTMTNYADVLGKLLPYAYQTADNASNNSLKQFEDLGFMPDPSNPGSIIPTLAATKQQQDQATQLANTLGFYVDPTTGKIYQTLAAAGQQAQTAHWQNQDSLANAQLNLSQSQFNEKSANDAAMIKYYQDNVANASNKNQASALLSELSDVKNQQDTYFAKNGKLDGGLQAEQQSIMSAIASLYGFDPSTGQPGN